MSERARRFHDAAISAPLTEAISQQGLEVRRIDDTRRSEVDPWLEAVVRGFLGGERNDTHRETFFALNAYRRKLGVYDPAAVQAETPIATFASWGAELTVPGGVVPACAISSVTVAPTHRRRGLLTQLMSGELTTAAALGFPVAVLTVSESGIYGRFGFAPAAAAAHWQIDTRRAGWRGPVPTGRIDFVSREHGRAEAPGVHERARLGMPGELDMPGGHWDRVFGTRADAEKADELRVLQYRSEAGAVDGLAVYKVTENQDDFAASSLDVVMLLAATDDAYAALWRFVLSMDLIGTVRAGELSVDEPLWWMIADQRAATITVRDHQYVRVLDVAETLVARRYDVADAVVLDVDDTLGFAAGRHVVTTSADGSASVVRDGDVPEGALMARVGVAELSAIVLGGVSPVTLAKAGRLQCVDPARLARLFASSATPRLSFWY